jgi:hypothetical protein
MSVIVPEIILFNAIQGSLQLIKNDWDATANKTQSLLYSILGTNQLQKYNLYEQAQAVFLAKKDSPRALDVNMFFNANRAAIPTIHITLPSETLSTNGLGTDEGFIPADQTAQTYNFPFTRRFRTKYNIIITSDNTNEVICIYHMLRACFIGLIPYFSVTGLEDPKLNGGDIQLNSSLVPPHVFMRAIGIEFDYEVSVPQLQSNPLTKDLIANFATIIQPL